LERVEETKRRKRFLSQFVLLLHSLILCLFVVAAWADPVLPHLISDHAVFQQNRDIHIWGNADPAERITISFANQTASTLADSAGRWSLELAPMHAGGPFTLLVAGKKVVKIKDVLIGEVWVASGQSNMTFALTDSTGAAEELSKADYPEVRLFTVAKKVSLQNQPDTLPAVWQPCTPESAREFSAVAYYFGRDLHNKLKIPIGIIESAWPGTTIEEWIAPAAADADPSIKPILNDWNRMQQNPFAEERQGVDLQFDDFELLTASPDHEKTLHLADFEDASTRNALGGYASYNSSSAPNTAFALVSPGRGGHGLAARVSGGLDASDDSRVSMRFHTDNSPADLARYAGIRFWVRGTGSFRFRSIQPTITDWDDYATQPIHASSDWTQVTIWFRDLRQEGWGVTREFTRQSLTGFVLECMPASGYPTRPATGLYHGMITPLLAYPFRGVIWYQGESNALQADHYRRLLPDLIESWRHASLQPDLQFLIVQLPNHGAIPVEPSESAWAELREAQLQTAKKVPGVGLAVTIDVGEPNDVHPHRKAEVGERLALYALGTTYQQPLVYSGPIYESMNIEGSAVRIRFTHTGSGLVAAGGGPPRGFAIAGPDREFHWAKAAIDGDSVLVSSPDVTSPVAVRYAWADSPECNLFNAEGLPASPFRTDNWPIHIP
jgi:sialate O-acetylesterase